MIQYIFEIRSMRQTIKEIEVNIAYRWYLGYGLNEPIPHFSTFGKNYVRRFKDTDLFEEIFKGIVAEIIECGFIDETSVFIDGTHIKANANNKKSKSEVVEKSIRFYEEELIKEINKDREEHGKKPLKEKEAEPETKISKISTTNPECGVFYKGEHKKVFAYTVNTVCDKNNYILGFHLTPGNIHDSVSFPSLYNQIKKDYKGIQNIVVDSGYKILAIAKLIIDDEKTPIMPYKRPMTKDGFFKKYEYICDEYYDCIICPNDQVLKYRTTNRDGYKEYKSNPKVCKTCPYLNQCINSKNHTKVVMRHIWENYIEQV